MLVNMLLHQEEVFNMKGRFFLSNAMAPSRAKDSDAIPNGTANLILNSDSSGSVKSTVVLRGKMEIPSYRIDNKWSNPSIKSPIGRLMDAINRRHTKMAETQNLIDEAKMVESWTKEYASNRGSAGTATKLLELVFNSSITPAQFLLNAQKAIFGNEMMGEYHSIEDSAKYFTDSVPTITNGLTFTATIIPYIDKSGKIVSARDYLECVKAICTGRLVKGKVKSNVSDAFVDGTTVKVKILEDFLNNDSNLIESLKTTWKEARKNSEDMLLAVEGAAEKNASGQKIRYPFFRYTPPVGYVPDLGKWNDGSAVRNTFSVQFGDHGRLDNLLIESFSVNPSKTTVKGKSGSSSTYYNVTIGLTPGYRITTQDLEGIH